MPTHEPEHHCDTGHFDRTICPEPCGTMHSFCSTCGKRQDACAHEPEGVGRGLSEEEREALDRLLPEAGFEGLWEDVYALACRIADAHYAQGQQDALAEVERRFREDAREQWGGDLSWLTTGSKVADLAACWVRDYREEIDRGGDDARA